MSTKIISFIGHDKSFVPQLRQLLSGQDVEFRDFNEISGWQKATSGGLKSDLVILERNVDHGTIQGIDHPDEILKTDSNTKVMVVGTVTARSRKGGEIDKVYQRARELYARYGAIEFLNKKFPPEVIRDAVLSALN